MVFSLEQVSNLQALEFRANHRCNVGLFVLVEAARVYNGLCASSPGGGIAAKNIGVRYQVGSRDVYRGHCEGEDWFFQSELILLHKMLSAVMRVFAITDDVGSRRGDDTRKHFFFGSGMEN